MRWTAWNNGSHATSGAGYGLKVPASDRDQRFDRRWKTVVVELPDGNEVEVNVAKASFWSTCRELIHRDIGRWLRASGRAPWQSGSPPSVSVEVAGARRFRVRP